GSENEYNAINKRLRKGRYRLNIIGRIFDKEESKDDEQYLGTLDAFIQIQNVLAVNEIVFSANRLSYRKILDVMQRCKDKCTYKIIPASSSFIISSQSKQNFVDAYDLYNINIGTASNKRNKRIIDIILSLTTIVLSPLWVITGKTVLLKESWH